jgi:GNAT superfamily N-acetyltransferase
MDLINTSNWSEELNNIPHGVIRGILFSGDRFSCCDEAVVFYKNKKFIGIATISSVGEYHDKIPDIVGLYISPEYRRQGYGLQILSAAIQRCLDRNLPTPIRITAISSNVKSLYNRLPAHLKSKVNFIDASLGLILQD